MIVSPGEYWRSNSQLQHITPPGERFPEIGLLPILKRVVKGAVTEFGCGDGRLCKAFKPELYLGYDINPAAIQAARKANPAFRFTDTFAASNTFLAHTVLLHVPDAEIEGVSRLAMQCNRVVIGEIMGRKWRRSGNPPVFNREPGEYADLFGSTYEKHQIPYPRYGCDLTILVFE